VHDYLVPVYATYLLATVALCAWLARTLYRNGALFLRDVFPDRPEMAEAVNHLLVTGFAMVNLGYGFFMMQASAATTSTEAFEVLARKLGLLLCSLAAVHFVNLYVFHRLAARRRQAELAPPVAPQLTVHRADPPATQLPPPPAPPARPGPFAPPAPFGPAPA
jgi:hypothetical protein